MQVSPVGNVTEDDKRLMAKTIAGELDLRQTDLTTPEGRAEADAILSTIVNRSQKYGGISKAILAPLQYSIWNDDKGKAIANGNYNKSPTLFDTIVNDFITDPTRRKEYTSYYNPKIASPDWGNKMENAQQIGPHKFGTLQEYAPVLQDLTPEEIARTTNAVINASAEVAKYQYDPYNVLNSKAPNVYENKTGYSIDDNTFGSNIQTTEPLDGLTEESTIAKINNTIYNPSSTIDDYYRDWVTGASESITGFTDKTSTSYTDSSVNKQDNINNNIGFTTPTTTPATTSTETSGTITKGGNSGYSNNYNSSSNLSPTSNNSNYTSSNTSIKNSNGSTSNIKGSSAGGVGAETGAKGSISFSTKPDNTNEKNSYGFSVGGA
jgi:hypothetical protein